MEFVTDRSLPRKVLDTPPCCVTTFKNTLYTKSRPDASPSRSQLGPGAFGRADPQLLVQAGRSRVTIESRVGVQSRAILL